MVSNEFQNGNDFHQDYGLGNSSDPMGSDSLLQIGWRNRWLMLFMVVVFIGLGFLYIQKATPIFTSESKIYVEQSGPKILSEAEGVMTQSKNYLYTQAELLKSTPIFNIAFETSSIKKMKSFEDVDNIIAYLKKNLNIEVGKKDDIISIAFDSAYPVEAADVINSIVDSYVTFHSTRKKSTSAEVLSILQKEKVKRNKELNDKLKELVDFKKEHEALAYENRNSNIILDRLASLSEGVTQAQLATIEAKSIYETTKAMLSDPETLKQLIEAQRAKGIYISTEDERTRLKKQLEELDIQYQELVQQVTSDHPSIVALKGRMDEVQSDLNAVDDRFASAQLAVSKQQYLAAKQREEEIVAYFNEQRNQALDLSNQLAQYDLLESDYEQTKKLSDILDDRIKELNITEDVGALNIQILEVAKPEDEPSKPQKTRVMALALVLGLMFGGGISMLRDLVDHRIRSTEEVEALLGVPVLGTVPAMRSRESVQLKGTKTHLEPTSPIAEAYKTIRTAVYFGVPEGQAKKVLVTSPMPGDGKTTLASNMAIAMAYAGQKTLLLDCDFRKPMQHKIFEIDQEDGLSSVLSGQCGLGDVLVHSDIENLDVLTCGPIPVNPSEMLNSKVFGDLVRKLESKYDRIIIDSPPVLPVTDARILGALCDITILVLRAEKSTRKISEQARDGLLNVGAKLLGTVVNDIHYKGRYGYYSKYGYRKYGYGYGGPDKQQKKKKVSKKEVVKADVSDQEDVQENS